MSDLKRKYEELKNQREKTIEELNQLREDDRVKRYIELQSKNETLYNEQIALYQELKKEEYSSCNHILVYSEIDYDRYEGRSYKRCGCIKCGLDGSVSSQGREYLPFSQKIMYDYLIRTGRPLIAITNKADKIAITKVQEQVSQIANFLNPLHDISFYPFSSIRKIYTYDVWNKIKEYI